jgi:mono/diheme cytochrome c family protein
MRFDRGKLPQMGAFTMRFSKSFALAVALVACSAALAQTNKYENVGKTATSEEIRAKDITILPSGKGLPPGKGTAKEGAPIYATHCAYCHGTTGKEGGPLAPKLVGDTSYERGPMTSWPFATSVWDYINRAMPRYQEGTLKPDQVYAVTAFLLYRSGIIKEDDVMDAKSLPELQMPNRNGWVPARLEDIPDLKKRAGRNGQYPGPDPTAAH